MTRVMILAAGEGSRWENYRGTPKHLTTIEDEVLLERTCRQFLRYTDDVIVVGADSRYEVSGTTLYIPPAPKPKWQDMAKFWSSHERWGSKRTVLAFGDVYYTDDAVKTIMENKDEWHCFLRKGPSSFTGCEWKEIFAFAFNGTQNQRFREKIMKSIAQKTAPSGGGWQLLRELVWDTHNYLFDNPYYTNIDDWTEDFDFPIDLTHWEFNRKNALKKTSSSSRSTITAAEKMKRDKR